MGMTLAGNRPELTVTTRNVRLVRFVAYRIHPEEVYGHVASRPFFSDFVANFRSRGTPPLRKLKVAEWSMATSDNGRHNLADDTMKAPLDSVGAYLVEAQAGDRGEVSQAFIVFVTDLTLVQKIDRDSVLVYAADARSGKPLPGVNLTVLTAYQQEQASVEYRRGITDESGACRFPMPPARLTALYD